MPVQGALTKDVRFRIGGKLTMPCPNKQNLGYAQRTETAAAGGISQFTAQHNVWISYIQLVHSEK